LAMGIGGGIIDPGIAGDGRLVFFAPFVFAAFFIVVNHFGAVFTDLDVFGRDGKDLLYAATGGRHLVQFGLCARRVLTVDFGILTGAAEDDGGIVVGEGVGHFIGSVEGKPSGIAPFGIHDEDIEVAVAIGGKGNLLPVAAPYGHKVVRFVKGQLRGFAAGAAYEVEIALVGKGDFTAIRGDGRIAHPAGADIGFSGEAGGAKREEDEKFGDLHR
jgi:hypothetical protein